MPIAAAAAAASRAAYVAYGWAERFSQISDELVEALEARVDADLWVEFAVDQRYQKLLKNLRPDTSTARTQARGWTTDKTQDEKAVNI